MQATLNGNALAPSWRLQFARRGTMMRSEKRLRPDPSRDPEQRYDRPPRRRRRRAGFFYKLITVILLLTLWPIGLILLWRRKLDWSTLAKVFTSIITLMACILIVGAALTVDTQNPRYTAIQNEVIGFLDSAADSIIDFSVDMGGRAARSLDALGEIRALYQGQSMIRAADAIDWGVGIATTVRTSVGEWFESLRPEPTPEPESETPEPSATAAVTDAPGATHPIIAQEPEPAATPAPTSVPAAQLTVSTSDDELPVYLPGGARETGAGAEIYAGMLLRSGELDADALPTPTPEPRPEDFTFAVKSAGEAIVYFNIGSGRYYHMTNVCGPMKDADEHTFAETAENIHEPCERCAPPDKSLLDEPYIVWLDANSLAHTSDECPAFEGQWKLVSAQDAIDAKFEACPECRADRYLAALADGAEVTVVRAGATVEPAAPEATPSPEPTPEPTLALTPEPSPQVVTPRETLKPAGDAVVYHSSNGRFYHMNDHCSGMTGGDAYTLATCVSGGFQQCNACGAPAPEALDHLCLWKDEDGVCHVSDECEFFSGQYALIERDAALEQNLVGCTHCGAVDYLIPFTVIDTYAALPEDGTL